MISILSKYVFGFRPFAPSVLREDISEWFEMEVDSPYMLMVDKVNQNKRRVISIEQEQMFGAPGGT